MVAGMPIIVGAVWTWVPPVLNVLVIFTSIFLILLVLIQRGKGGGLSGAFGGSGGSSAFGSRAGDLFTRITLILASIWVALIMVHIRIVQSDKTSTPQTSVLDNPR